jgi:serine/threonine protein kinase
MAETFGFDMDKIKAIIQSNNTIKRTTHTYVKDFLTVQAEFLEKVNEIYGRLDTVEHVANIFIDQERKDILDKYQPLEQVQLAVCGYNNTGKTSFIHELLGLGDFLPADEGAVTARIVKFSYTPAETACLIKYTSVNDSTEVGDREDLSNYFMSNMTKKERTKGLRKLIRGYLARPEGMDKISDAFEEWAKTFIEIRIPAPILELGLHIYDTPGFLGSDPPVLRDNLLDLVRRVHPTLVFLYDNATVPDDSRKCYEKLKEALHSQVWGVDIFFLNTKADVAVIRKNASNQDDDDDDDNELLKKARLYRYNLLLDVDEMKGDINNPNKSGQAPSLEECQCFDIFSTVTPTDPMEKVMKDQAVGRIIHYAAEHDIRPTKLVINVVHVAIGTFFDFVLITNRRSRDEWEKLRDEALEWGEHFFKQHRDSVNHIAAEAKRRLPECFHEKYDDIKKRVLKNCEMGVEPLNGLDSSSKDSKVFKGTQFIDMLMEREIIKPIIQQIICERSDQIKRSMNEEDFICYRNKNELFHAAYRQFLVDIGAFDGRHNMTISDIIFLSIGYSIVAILMSPIVALAGLAILALWPLWPLAALGAVLEYFENKVSAEEKAARGLLHRKESALTYLGQFEEKLSAMSNRLQENMMEWIGIQDKKFSKRVNNYFKIVCRTIEDRHRAYELARSFAPRFARIECRLEANLNLATHHGSRPVIHHQEVLGIGGFFTVHPASWDGENELVAKKLRDYVTNQDFAYLEAHFHRTVTSLNVPHMVHLKYLYEENDSSLYLLLPRYDTDLHSFLQTNMKKMTADKAIQISHDIAGVIAHMHAHDLVHRDIKVQNILMDKQEQVYLADFGTCQHGIENNTFVGTRPLAPDLTTLPLTNALSSSSSHQHSYQGTAVDVYLLGMLMYVCAPKDTYIPPSDNTAEQIHLLDRRRVPENYCQLITRCLNKDFKKRPTAKQIVEELDAMAKQLCIICEEAPRFVRFEPCGHNVVCVGCLDRIQKERGQTQCIVCKQVFTSTREDNDANTFIATSKNSA